MKKVLIAIQSKFTNESFRENFFQEGFQVATTTSGREALEIINQAPPDAILADANLPELNAFEILERIKDNEKMERIPFIVYSRSGAEEHRERAMDLEARDFVVGLSDPPKDVVMKVKSHLGEQKAYILDISSDMESGAEIARDMGYKYGARCSSCNNTLSLHLLRNLSWGENAFKVSLICPRCSFRHGINSE